MPNENRMGVFICELRREKGLTQKQLAEQLCVTDKAISKWERGVGYPDITLLTKLADSLGVTTNELLSGSRASAQPESKPQEAIVSYTLAYADGVTQDRYVRRRRVAAFILSAVFLTAAVICMICNLALSGHLSWAVYPISSLLFAWLLLMPPLCFRRLLFSAALLSASVFILPFLLVLNQAMGGDWFFPVAVPCTLASLAWVWIVYLATVISKSGWLAASAAMLCIVPLNFCIDLAVGAYTHIPPFNGWNLVELVVCLTASGVLFFIGRLRRHAGSTV